MNLDAQSVTNLLTLALAVATVWLAIATQQMARASKASIELQSTPYLAIEGLTFGLGHANDLQLATPSGIVRLGLLLLNPGHVLVNYEVEELTVTFSGTSLDKPSFLTKRGVVHPGAKAQYFYPTIKISDQLRPGQMGEVRFKLAFWTTQQQIKHVEGKTQFTLQSLQPAHVDWLYVEGPSYV